MNDAAGVRKGGLWCWLWTYQTEAESDGSLTSKPLPRGRGGEAESCFAFIYLSARSLIKYLKRLMPYLLKDSGCSVC